MECHCIAPTELPHQTLLYRTYVTEASRLRDFYPYSPDVPGIRRAAEHVRYETGIRAAVVAILREQNGRFGSGETTSRNLDCLAGGALAVVTGQQVGLFTGPAYSVYKAIAAVRVARDLTEGGTPAVPVFWMATEDHDLAEIQRTNWLGRDALEIVTLDPQEEPGGRVGEIHLGEGVRAAVEKARAQLDGPGAAAISRVLAESYTPGETFGSAFARLMARLFATQGLILLDPLDKRLHMLSAPLYHRVIEENVELTRDLLARSRQLEKAHYHAQVKVTESSVPLFLSLDGRRLPIRRRNNGFVVGNRQFTAAELLGIAGDHPEDFSANALLRPVLSDWLLPTAACVAGPAEIAYLAQSEVLYRRLLGRMPAVLPRASFTLVEPRIARLLKKYDLKLGDFFRGAQFLRSKMERQSFSRLVSGRFDKGEKQIRKILESLRQPLKKLDKTLLGARNTAERKVLYQFERLRQKTARAEAFRRGVIDAHEQQVTDALYPHRGLQERSLCLLPFLARNGLELLDTLSGRFQTGDAHHRVLYL